MSEDQDGRDGNNEKKREGCDLRIEELLEHLPE